MQTAAIVLASILSTLLIGSVGVFVWNSYRKRVAIWTDAAATAKSLNEVMRANTESLATVPALLEGMKKIAAEQVIQINALRTEIAQFRKMMFKRDDMRAVQNPTEDEKGYWYEVQRMMAENPMMTQEQALQKVIEQMSAPDTREFNLG